MTKVLARNNNIAIGVNAGTSLIDGQKNFFMGDNIAVNITTGTSNFFLGHEVANNMKMGSRNISLMGDQLVDGVDDQINIGAIFYYNGDQLLTLDTNVSAGYGTQSTSTTTGALVVSGGIGMSGNAYIGGTAHVTSGTASISTITGALVVAGGVGIQGDVYARTGNPLENYQLYTPSATIQEGSSPANPRLGDIWIDPSIGASFIYIQDGANKIWLQFNGI
jgi:hypothetical protein